MQPIQPKWTDNRINTVQEKEQPMPNDVFSRIFGGSPLGVLVRLALLSIVVGFILHEAHINPQDILNSLGELLRRIWEMGLEPLHWLWRYFALGAVVVVPVWLLIRLTRGLAGK
jgi:hypothetical protein